MVLPNVVGAILVGLAMAACWGTADFLAAVIGRRMTSTRLVLGMQITGVPIGLLAVAIWRGWGTWTGSSLVIDTVVLGALGTATYLFLYAALEAGPVAIVSPISSAYPIATVALEALVHNIYPGRIRAIGMGLLVIGVVAVASWGPVSNQPTSRRGIPLAFAAALCLGSTLFALDAAPHPGNLLPIVLLRVGGTILLSPMLIPWMRDRPTVRTVGSWLWMALPVGILDTLGIIIFRLGANAGQVDVVATVGSLTAAVPVILGVMFLKERLRVHQWGGIVLVLAGLVELGAV
ncbi:MAG: DMT family transporter [Chloroflexota bacterium]